MSKQAQPQPARLFLFHVARAASDQTPLRIVATDYTEALAAALEIFWRMSLPVAGVVIQGVGDIDRCPALPKEFTI